MSESTKADETCMHCGGEVVVVIDRQSGQWGPDGPIVSFEDRRSRCQSCGEEWYDFKQSMRHTAAILQATVAALTAENERLRSRANDSSRKPTKSTYSREVGVSNGQGGVSMLTGACSEAHARAYGLLREQPE